MAFLEMIVGRMTKKQQKDNSDGPNTTSGENNSEKISSQELAEQLAFIKENILQSLDIFSGEKGNKFKKAVKSLLDKATTDDLDELDRLYNSIQLIAGHRLRFMNIANQIHNNNKNTEKLMEQLQATEKEINKQIEILERMVFKNESS